MEHRDCAVCGTLLLHHEHIGMPVAQEELTGMLIMGSEICSNCLKKYMRQSLVEKAIRKLQKTDKSIARKCFMVYHNADGKGFEVLVMSRLPRDVEALFSNKPNNLPFGFE